jgi:hypothetical protein
MSSTKWVVIALGILSATPAAAEQLPPATIALPGLFAPELDPADRELFGQQLAATLEGQGFTVLDAEALAARDIEVSPAGCASPLPPLCGAGAGVDQVIVGSIVSTEEGELRVSIEFVDARTRRQLWAGGFVADEAGQVSAGLQAIGTEHLPLASRRARLVDDRPRFLGLTQHAWGGTLMVSGLLMSVGSGLLFSEAAKIENRLDNHGARLHHRIYARDALRMRDTYRTEVAAGIVLGAAGVTSLVAGVLLQKDAPQKPVAVQFVPAHNAGMLVFSGVLP